MRWWNGSAVRCRLLVLVVVGVVVLVGRAARHQAAHLVDHLADHQAAHHQLSWLIEVGRSAAWIISLILSDFFISQVISLVATASQQSL